LKTVLIGFGDIAPKYLEVLNQLNCKVTGILTRNYDTGLEKAKKYGIKKAYKSFTEINDDDPDFFIILTSPENNGKVLRKLIPFKKPILVEKPVAFSSKEICKIINFNRKFSTPIVVTMNRRFYSIFEKGLQYLQNHNKKINAIKIDAPEKFSDINLPKFNPIVKKNWMFCNSIHCVDLIRFFGGDVKKIKIHSIPKKYCYSAVGHCDKDIEFTYLSNWKSPGNWSVTLYADDIRINYTPLENGTIITKNKIIELKHSKEDLRFKPGFYFLLKHFQTQIFNKKNQTKYSSSLHDHKKTIKLIETIYQIKN